MISLDEYCTFFGHNLCAMDLCWCVTIDDDGIGTTMGRNAHDYLFFLVETVRVTQIFRPARGCVAVVGPPARFSCL